MSRRTVLTAGAALLLAGCGDIPVFSTASNALRAAAFSPPDPPIQRAAISKLPYATVTAKIGKAPRAVLVLSRYDGPDLHWVAADRSVIVTRHGRVVKTAGLAVNLKNTRSFEADPLDSGPHRIDKPRTFVRYVDIDQNRRYGMPIHSTFETVGQERITIVELEFDTVVVRESNKAKTINWDFENLYWVDAIDGFMWKSRQHIARSLPPLAIEVLKPAA